MRTVKRLVALVVVTAGMTVVALLLYGAPIGQRVQLVGIRLQALGGGQPITTVEEVEAIAQATTASMMNPGRPVVRRVGR